VAALAGLSCALIWIGDPTTPGGLLPACPTKSLLGIDCPGCGTLRMVYSLLHGDVLAELHYNAVALIALVMLAVAYVAWIYGRVRGRQAVSWLQHRWVAHATLAVVIVWFVIRNIPVWPFSALRV